MCDVCEQNVATLLCRQDNARLCQRCDEEMHSANKVVARHIRVALHDVRTLSSTIPISLSLSLSVSQLLCLSRSLSCDGSGRRSSVMKEVTFFRIADMCCLCGLFVACSNRKASGTAPRTSSCPSNSTVPLAACPSVCTAR